MDFKQLLAQNRSAIVGQWRARILDGYAPEGSRFLGRQKDRFANPIGHAIEQGTEALFDELLEARAGRLDGERIARILDEMVRISAVQQAAPSEAVGFLFLLKPVVRETLKEKLGRCGFWDDLLAFESKIDEMALAAFDVYMKCREKLQQIKIKELKQNAFIAGDTIFKSCASQEGDSRLSRLRARGANPSDDSEAPGTPPRGPSSSNGGNGK